MEVDNLIQIVQLHKAGFSQPAFFCVTFIKYFSDKRVPLIAVETQSTNIRLEASIVMERLIEVNKVWECSLGYYHKGYCNIDLFDLLDRNLRASMLTGDYTYATVVLNAILNRHAGFNSFNPKQMQLLDACSNKQKYDLIEALYADRDDVTQEELGVTYKSKINFKNKIRNIL